MPASLNIVETAISAHPRLKAMCCCRAYHFLIALNHSTRAGLRPGSWLHREFGKGPGARYQAALRDVESR